MRPDYSQCYQPKPERVSISWWIGSAVIFALMLSPAIMACFWKW